MLEMLVNVLSLVVVLTYGNMWCTTWYSMMPWNMWRPMKPKSRSMVEAAPLMKVQSSAS